MPILFAKNYAFCLSACVSLLLLAACHTKEKPVTKDEAMAMAKTIEQSIVQKNASFLNDAIDLDLLTGRMDFPNKGSLLQQQGFKTGLKEKLKFGSIILQSLGKGNYRIVKEYNKGDTQHLVFRLYASGSINYHDLELAHVNGKCKIADAFIYLSGEKFSETMANIYKYLDVGNGVSDKDVQAMQKMGDIRSMMHANDYDGAKRELEKLPLHIRNMKAMQLTNILIMENLNDNDAYEKAIEDYQALYPNEPNMYLLEIDGYFLQKKYPQVLEAINQLDKAINKDPLLDYQRSLVYKTMGDPTNQKKCLDRLTTSMPDFEDGALEMVAYYLKATDYNKASVAIADYKKHADYDKAVLKTVVDEYPGYKE